MAVSGQWQEAMEARTVEAQETVNIGQTEDAVCWALGVGWGRRRLHQLVTLGSPGWTPKHQVRSGGFCRLLHSELLGWVLC